MSEYVLVYSIYMKVEADNEDDAFKKADLTAEACLEEGIHLIDEHDGIKAVCAFTDWAAC